MILKIMTPGDKQWRKFGKHLKEELSSEDCDATSFSLSEQILQKHYPEYDIEKTFEFFMTHRACCDCEVLYNVYMNVPGTYYHDYVSSIRAQRTDNPDDVQRRIADPTAPHTKNFPYLVERMMPGVYNIIPRSADTSIDDLVAEAKDIVAERNHRVCVVLGPKRGLYVEPDGSVNENESIPSGGFTFQVEFKKKRHRSFRHQRTRYDRM
jgi:hypothetical protein